jgi:hypothetical protein
MRILTLSTALLSASLLFAQTEVRVSSYTFANGVYPTFSVAFTGTDPSEVEKFFKGQLKSISADVSTKKELMAIGTRLPEVSGDTIRVFIRCEQLKRSPEVTTYVAFRVGDSFVGPDSEQRQSEGCRNWVYQQSVMLKKELAQHEVEAATKELDRLESDLAGLIKEKDRAQSSIERTQENITEAQQEKVATDGELTTLETRLNAKNQEVQNAPTEGNTKELQAMLKEQDKLKRKSERLEKSATDGKRKIEDLQYQIKKNLADQDAKSTAIDAQRKVVSEKKTKLGSIN